MVGRAWILASVFGVGGCYAGAQIGDGDGDGDGDDDDGDDDDADDDGTDGDDACVAPVGTAHLRRLTNTELRNSVRDLFGPGLEAATAALPRDEIIAGFDNNAEVFAMSDVHVERYRDAAESIARSVVEDAERSAAVIGCDATAATCRAAFVPSLARLAWRRTPTAEEIDALLAVADAATDDPEPTMPARLAIEAILQSPSFLLRIEVGEADPDDPARLRLTGPEVATRLSYLVLASTPPSWLLDAAEAGELGDADGVEEAARTLLADERAREGLRNFHTQWLRLPLLAGLQRDPELHPQWTATLAASMAEETARYVDDHVWNDGADFLDVLVAPYAWVDTDLAALYGVAAPDGFARIDLDPAQKRGGLLTQASVLTLTAKNESGMPIFRGNFVREVLLCQSLPPPPSDVPAIPDPIPGESDRERLERHRTDPACNGCHALLDPLGFGLAEYDAIGKLRTLDSSGAPVDARGSLDGYEQFDFDGALELSALLRDDPAVADCFVHQLFRYVSARRESTDDACALEHLGAAFDDAEHSVVEALVAWVRSDAFRYRLPHEEDR